ncbi:PRC-barrel domain-containing protein [Geminicoccaceae bacterium 1502E]|nr:PRC-barrel domain-containing protein [Geminicoccaceae bacterium 1502E]
MLHSLEILRESTVEASDGEIGSIDDIYFDDRSSTVRYLVVDTGSWLSGRKVLVSPSAFELFDADRRRAVTRLTSDQVRNSPEIDTHRPLSRQMEESLHEHYGWTPYWAGGAAPALAIPWGPVVPIAEPLPGRDVVEQELEERRRSQDDPHLRSGRTVTGYYIHASDGDIGHVADLLLDETASRIRYVVVDTANWLPGRKVLVAVKWFHDVNWSKETITADLTKEQIRSSPEYDPIQIAGNDYETRLWTHYGRTPYW